MLSEILEIWRGDPVMKDVVARLAQMVSDSAEVLSTAWTVCRGEAKAADMKATVREKDKAVNRQERQIRCLLAEHLVIRPGRDHSGCLAVLIMAKDAERLGDHGRNLFDLAARAEGELAGLRVLAPLDALQKRLMDMLGRLREAIVTSDEKTAHGLLDDYLDVKAEIKQLRNRLFEEEWSGREAVLSTFLVRYFMRINAHLGNMASGVIFPLQNIDFVSRGLKEEQKDR